MGFTGNLVRAANSNKNDDGSTNEKAKKRKTSLLMIKKQTLITFFELRKRLFARFAKAGLIP